MPAKRRVTRLDRFRYAEGGTPTAALRLAMQKTMQANCAVFRTEEVLVEGRDKHSGGLGRGRGHQSVATARWSGIPT